MEKKHSEELIDVDLGLIDVNKENFYNVDPLAVEDLARDFCEEGIGLLQPLFLLKNNHNERYTLLDGETRFKALLLREFKKAPAKVFFNMTEDEAKYILIRSNAYRDKTSKEKQDEAAALLELYNNKKNSNPDNKIGNTKKLLANDLKISEATASRLMRIENKLIPEFKEEMRCGVINQSEALAVIKAFGADESQQMKLYKTFVNNERKELKSLMQAFKNQTETALQNSDAPDNNDQSMGYAKSTDDIISSFNTYAHEIAVMVSADTIDNDTLELINMVNLKSIIDKLESQKEHNTQKPVDGQIEIEQLENTPIDEIGTAPRKNGISLSKRRKIK